MKIFTTGGRRKAQVLTTFIVWILIAEGVAAFWFICSYRDAAKAAEIAGKARERYYEYLADPRASRAQIDACKQAWDVLRNATFSKITDFATSVPGTSLTGPPNIKDLTKEAIKEAIKEVL